MPHRLPSTSDVVVIGGGVIGLAVAWELAERGLRVTLLERDRLGGGTSYLAAGMLAPVAEADPAERPLLELSVTAAAGYPEFIARLGEASPLDPGYLSCGTLMLARDGDEAEALSRGQALREELGLEVRRLRPSQARALEPALAPTARLALELPADHAVDPRALLRAMADAFTRAGGSVCEGTTAQGLIRAGDRITGVRLEDGRELASEHVVVAGGPWSGELAGLPAETRPGLRPVKGQILRLHDPAGPGLLRRVLRLEAAYLVPRGDGRYVLGATVEERGFDTTVTAGAVLGLLEEAAEAVPGVSELVIDELSAGLRPGTPDNAPVIGGGGLDGLLWATGHYRGGVLLAPVTAQAIAALIAGEQAPVELGPFAPERFAAVGAAS